MEFVYILAVLYYGIVGAYIFWSLIDVTMEDDDRPRTKV